MTNLMPVFIVPWNPLFSGKDNHILETDTKLKLFWLGESVTQITGTDRLSKYLLWFSSKIREIVATTAFFVFIWPIWRYFSDSAWPWRGGSRCKIQISPALCHEVEETRPRNPEFPRGSSGGVIVAGLCVFVVIFSTSFLQKYATQNPIVHWNPRALQKRETRLLLLLTDLA